MTIIHVTRQPPKYNAIQWTGDNEADVQAALNPNLLLVSSNFFTQKLQIRDKFTNNQVASALVGSWIISGPYNGVETDQFGTTLEVLTDEDFQLQFIQPPAPTPDPEPTPDPVSEDPPVDPGT